MLNLLRSQQQLCTSHAVLEPGVGPGPYGGIGTAPNTSLAGQVISVAWTIDFVPTLVDLPHTGFFADPTSIPISFSIRVTAREISASRRKFHMQADAIIRTANP